MIPISARCLSDPAYSKAILSIGRGGKKPRKDITVWSGAKEYLSFFFDELFRPDLTYPEHVTAADAKKLLTDYQTMYDPADDSGTWFERVKTLAESVGYATNMKEYKKDPAAWPGNVADASMVLRVAVTGRQNSPDLCEVMKLLGPARSIERLRLAAEKL